MGREISLRRRIVAAYTLLAVVVCLFFAMVVHFTVRETEKNLVERRLASIAEWQFARKLEGGNPELPPGIQVYTGAAIPVQLSRLPSGFHDVTGETGTLDVLSSTSLRGERFVAVDEIGAFRKIEREAQGALGLGILLSIALAVALGRLTAGRVVAPLTELAGAVERDELDERSRALTLNDEIGMLARTFASRTAQLHQFLFRERLFTGDVSHELRTPLTVILGAAEVLATRLGGHPELSPVVERIHRTVLDTADLVAALLLLSRSPEALDAPRLGLLALVEREIERCRPLLVGKPVSLVLRDPQETWVYARPELAGMAIGNLLRNACHYTERGEVAVRLTGSSLEIEDTGPGLPSCVRAQLFDRFVRGERESQSGAGLGLAIVKRISEHLAWAVRLEERVGGGSRFVLLFPEMNALGPRI